MVGRAAAAAAGLLCLCCSIGLAFRCSSTDVVWDDRITASLRGWRAVLGALSLSHGPTATHPSRVLPCWSHDDDAAVALRPVVPFGVACGVGSPLFGCYPPPWAGWLPLLRLAGWPTTHSRALAARLLSAGRSSSSVGGQTGTGCIGSPAASHARTHGTRTHNPAASAALPLRTGRRFVRLAAAVPCRGVWRGVRRALPGGGGGGGGLPRGEIAHTLTHPSHHPLTALSLFLGCWCGGTVLPFVDCCCSLGWLSALLTSVVLLAAAPWALSSLAVGGFLPGCLWCARSRPGHSSLGCRRGGRGETGRQGGAAAPHTRTDWPDLRSTTYRPSACHHLAALCVWVWGTRAPSSRFFPRSSPCSPLLSPLRQA